MSQPRVTIGRTVHYYDLNDRCLAAIVTGVRAVDTEHDGQPAADLTVFPPGDEPRAVPGAVWFSEKPEAGCWTWPPRA